MKRAARTAHLRLAHWPGLQIIVIATLTAGALAQSAPDTYVYQTTARVQTLDPAAAYDAGSLGVIENLYETLYTYDRGALDTPVPALATGYSVSEDELTWTFALRPGVRFHSGNAFACRDVEYSFQYATVVANPDGAATQIMGRRWLGTDLDGSDAQAYGAAVAWDAIDRVVSCPDGPDGLVAEVRLIEPTGALLAIVANPSFSVLDSQFAIAGGSWDGAPASWRDWIGRDLTGEFLNDNASGTGAYRLASIGDRGVSAFAFQEYWGGAPPLARVEIVYVDDQGTRESALLAGEADRVELSERSAASALAESGEVALHEAPDWAFATVTALFFNFDVAGGDAEAVGSGALDGEGIPSDFFADADVRKGFAHLFDQVEFVASAYGGNGVALSAPLPPSFSGYDDAAEVRSLDLDAATAHFRAAQQGRLWEVGFKFTAYYNLVNTVRRDALEMIRGNLEALNPRFRMEVRGLPWGEFLVRVADGQAPLFALSWGADYADPSAFVATFLDADGHFSKRTHVDLPEVQALLDAAEVLHEPSERARHFRQIATLQYDLAPMVLVPLQTWFVVTRSDLSGVYFNPMRAGQFLWRDLSK